jgi:hypothetical protein
MPGRTLDPDFASAMQEAHVEGFVLVEMQLDSGTFRVCGLPFAFIWGADTYLPALGLGSVAKILETDTEVHGLSFTLSGVPSSAVAMTLQENVQGRRVIVRYAVLEGTTVYVDENVWDGLLDVMTLDDNGETSTITVSAEHTLAAWGEPNEVLYSHEAQQLIAPGDMFFEFAAKMSNATIVWPGKEFFRR